MPACLTQKKKMKTRYVVSAVCIDFLINTNKMYKESKVSQLIIILQDRPCHHLALRSFNQNFELKSVRSVLCEAVFAFEQFVHSLSDGFATEKSANHLGVLFRILGTVGAFCVKKKNSM